MSDGQSFYLVLALFYLLECLKFAPPESLAMVSRFGETELWKPRRPFLMAWGIGKSVFAGTLLPWPSSVYMVTGSSERDHEAKKLTTVAAVRRMSRFLRRITAQLRRLSLFVFLAFFLLIPLLYSIFGDGWIVLAAAVLSYLTLIVAAVHFNRLHRRLFPKSKADRFKCTLYTAILPWHAMRCSDELFQKSSSQWSPLAALCANSGDQESLSLLKRHWRAAHFQADAPYRKDTLERMLASAGIDSSAWLAAPAELDAPQYCPCCHGGYERLATHCADCHQIPLLSPVASEQDHPVAPHSMASSKTFS